MGTSVRPLSLCKGATLTPLRAQMIYQMQLERLAPKTQAAYVTAVAGLATFYHCSPDQLSPEQMRHYLHHVLVDRHRSALRGPAPAHAGVFPCRRMPPTAQMRQHCASPAPHRRKSPIFSASTVRPTAVPIPSRPRIRR